VNTRSRTILVIEDNPVFSRIIRHRLENDGFHVVEAEDGISGLSLARKIRPDLIVLDLMLPILDGHKVCRLLKFDRNLRSTPVAIFTSRDTDHDTALAKASHADTFIAKTVKPAVMLDAVRKLIDRAEQFATEKIVFQGKEYDVEICR